MSIPKSVFQLFTMSIVIAGEMGIFTNLSTVVRAQSSVPFISPQFSPNLTQSYPNFWAFDPPDKGTPGRRESGGSRLKQDWNGFEPPDRGTPGRREPGGTRGTCPAGTEKIQALIPQTTAGGTSMSHPTLFFYVPMSLNQTVKLELDDQSEQLIGSKTFNLKVNNPGIVSLSLPSDPQWQIRPGQNYKWYLTVVCDPKDIEGNIFLSGWFNGFTLNPTQQTTISQGNFPENLKIYQREFLWYDTLTTLANLLSRQPSDAQLRSQWEELLKSVNLGTISQQPLVESQWIPLPDSEDNSQ